MLWVVACVLVVSTAAYFVQQQLVHLLLKPAHGQQFIYTSPGGGIGFLFTLCTYVGLIASLPVVTYHLVRFLEPVLSERRLGLVWRYGLASLGMMAVALVFGYEVGLPAALHFLSHQFSTPQIHPLFTVQEYLSFVTVYLLGTVLLFQLPLIMIEVQRLKPRPPRRWLRLERYVVAGAFIVAMIMVPTPNVVSQLVIAGPVIVIYNLAVIVIWIGYRRPGGEPAIVTSSGAEPGTTTARGAASADELVRLHLRPAQCIPAHGFRERRVIDCVVN